MMARHTPFEGSTSEVVQILQPLIDVPTGDAFVVEDVAGRRFVAWSDELTFLTTAELVR